MWPRWRLEKNTKYVANYHITSELEEKYQIITTDSGSYYSSDGWENEEDDTWGKQTYDGEIGSVWEISVRESRQNL